MVALGVLTTPSPLLFEPLALRSMTARNRIWLAPMCQYSCFARDGVPTDWHLAHLGARAAGGFGLLLTEAAAVAPEGRISPEDAGIWNEEQGSAWARIVRFVHSQDAKIGVQLAHAGRKASTYANLSGGGATGSVPLADGGWQTLAPSTVPYEGFADPAAMTTDQIAETVADFAAAARRADEAGFDTVEIHGAHGYLIHQFLSPLSNRREDEYGGSFANRTRFLLKIVDAIRAVFPEDKPVLVRLSGTEWTDGGFDADDTARLAPILREHDVDLVDISSAGNVLADVPVGPGYQVALAAGARRAGEVPTGAVGLITEPAQAEEILSTGNADVVLLARAALREPAWPLRAAHELGVAWHDSPLPAQYARAKWPDAA